MKLSDINKRITEKTRLFICAKCHADIGGMNEGWFMTGAVTLCPGCYERLSIADEVCKRTRNETPDVIKDLFGKFERRT